MENIKSSLKKWHQFVETKNHKILDELLASDVIFHSPIVWTPQEGQWITKAYLIAASEVLGAENSDFTYISEVINKNKCILEFTTLIDGISINGVDMIEINNEGKIICFKVMIRPLKAVNKIHEKMGEMLEKLTFQKGK